MDRERYLWSPAVPEQYRFSDLSYNPSWSPPPQQTQGTGHLHTKTTPKQQAHKTSEGPPYELATHPLQDRPEGPQGPRDGVVTQNWLQLGHIGSRTQSMATSLAPFEVSAGHQGHHPGAAASSGDQWCRMCDAGYEPWSAMWHAGYPATSAYSENPYLFAGYPAHLRPMVPCVHAGYPATPAPRPIRRRRRSRG